MKFPNPARDDELRGIAPDQFVAATEQNLVVMFTDLVGFSRITAAAGNRAAGALLARALGMQIGVVECSSGTVRNIMGDAIMASWNLGPGDARAPTCARAVQAAFAIASALQKLDSPLPRQRGLGVRIGLHVGPALLGTVAAGHPNGRTLIGDTVNIAAKLQQARESDAVAEPIGSIRISEDLYQELPAIQQRTLPARSVVWIGDRFFTLRSGFGAGAGNTPRLGWTGCLDRLGQHLATV